MTLGDLAHSESHPSAAHFSPDDFRGSPALLPAEVIDSFAALIATSSDAPTRASVAVSLLEQVYATVASLDDQAVERRELASLDQVLSEIRAHRDRMTLASGPASGWPRKG